MENQSNLENLILDAYFFDKKNNTFLLKIKDNKTTQETYIVTSEKIKIIRTLENEGIEYIELETEDIKII